MCCIDQCISTIKNYITLWKFLYYWQFVFRNENYILISGRFIQLIVLYGWWSLLRYTSLWLLRGINKPPLQDLFPRNKKKQRKKIKTQAKENSQSMNFIFIVDFYCTKGKKPISLNDNSSETIKNRLSVIWRTSVVFLLPNFKVYETIFFPQKSHVLRKYRFLSHLISSMLSRNIAREIKKKKHFLVQHFVPQFWRIFNFTSCEIYVPTKNIWKEKKINT